ncbi:TPR domain-containing protein [Colletotrichum kahawae]|uniref:TPR domain-containing protein n=1 Tax=Colletotrichum kahawae TaxID=34407 RepID=A0AAE0D741_COLKA|nr:TPR domain-containing protein [Colletotrichum kahawae]
MRSRATSNVADLDNAIFVEKQALTGMTPEWGQVFETSLKFVADMAWERYKLSHSLPHLRESILHTTRILESISPHAPRREQHCGNLITSLDKWLDESAKAPDQVDVVAVTRSALSGVLETDSCYHDVLHMLESGLFFEFKRSHKLEDLDEAIAVARMSIEAAPLHHPKRVVNLTNIGLGLRHRFNYTHQISDIDDSILHSRNALDIVPAGLERDLFIQHLVQGLKVRYTLLGALADLDKSISILEDLISTLGENDPRNVGRLSVLGGMYSRKFHRTMALADMEIGIRLARSVVKGTDTDESSRPGRLLNLATQLKDRAKLTDKVEDINEAISLGYEALAVSSHDQSKRCSYMNNIGNLLGERFDFTGDMADLNQCIEYINEGIKAAPTNHDSMNDWLVNLGAQMSLRFCRTSQKTDRDQARAYLRSVLNSEQSEVSTRISAAYHLLPKEYMDEDKHEAFLDARTAVNLIPLSAPLSLQPEDRQSFLTKVAGFASEAAAIALNDGQSPEIAIELLETGRGVLASFFHDRRTDLSLLEAEHPKLASSFRDLRAELDKPTRRDILEDLESFGDMDSPSQLELPETDQRHKASTKMAVLLDEIRTQPGFERFLCSATGMQMQEVAEAGPIVIINISHRRCDAFIIEKSRIHHLELPSLTRDDVLRRVDEMRSFETLMWLWESVVGPVLDYLGLKHCVDDSWPHVVWIPTGPLVRFPLHAAGYHLAPGHKTAIDRVISSYSSSVKAVMISRQQHYHVSGSDVVLIGMGETPGLPHSNLRYATAEIDAVRGVFNSTSLKCVQPTSIKKDVLAALETCRIFHFAGHGESNRLDPLKSQILLNDWTTQPLTTASLMEKNLASNPPFLAYLSACKTSENSNQDLVDENIHLTSAFQLSGFRHVVGTLWEVDDELSSEMAKLTYEFLATKGISDSSVSGGLHFATKKLRDIWAASVIADVKHGEKVDGVRNAVHDHDQEGVTSHPGEDLRSLRDIRRAEVILPLWVPYIHYGP